VGFEAGQGLRIAACQPLEPRSAALPVADGMLSPLSDGPRWRYVKKGPTGPTLGWFGRTYRSRPRDKCGTKGPADSPLKLDQGI
jgi:hypothetical protein